MEFRVLGPLELWGPGDTKINLASAAQRRLTSFLVQRANTIVPAETLEEHLGLTPGALRTSVSRLRRLVGFDTLITTPPGYTLRTDRIDAIQFDALVALARSSNDRTARDALAAAVMLWRGDAYAEFAHEEWAAAEVARLTELRACALEELAQMILEAGEATSVITMLEPVIATFPFRDRPRGLLMRALADAGRRTDALREFQAYRAVLGEEIGTEPSPFLVVLDRAIAAQTDDPDSTLPPLPEHPAWGRERRLLGSPLRFSPKHNLPSAVGSFIGRDDERAALEKLIGEHRIVTLTGPGGCGKTRLALCAASDLVPAYEGGVWWVELGPVTRPSEVEERLAASIGFVAMGSADVTTQLIGRLSDAGPVLIALDNAEHVVDGVAGLVDRVLTECPNVTVLVTSREQLGLPGEMVWVVPPLSAPDPGAPISLADLDRFDATRLFLERARCAGSDLVVDEAAAPQIASICARLDGLPLALELAAAHTRSMPIERIAAGLDDSMRLLSQGSRRTLARHQTLHASIAWSVDLLDDIETKVLSSLTVFRSPFLLDGAVEVATDGGNVEALSVIRALGRLVDKSLLQFDAAASRYRMLETIRQFCDQRAHGTPELDRARARHAHYRAAWCTAVGEGRYGVERGQFVREMPDVIAAMKWARQNAPIEALRICSGLGAVRTVLGYNVDMAETWDWLMAFDRDGELASEWASAVAARMSTATGLGLDVSSVGAEAARRLPEQNRRAARWLARGNAMVPAYRGDLAPILEYAQSVVAEREDLEISIYVGFAAYMLSVAGRLDEATHLIGEQRRMTRRQHTTFSVDSVGNGYAAAILVAAASGDLTAAANYASVAVPADPAFSMTAADALAQVALMTDDLATLRSAIEWSRRGTIPMLSSLATWIECARRTFDGDVERAADAAERYWEEATPIPLNRVHRRAFLNIPLLESGRAAAVEAANIEATAVVAEMVCAPLCKAVVWQSRAQLALCRGDLSLLVESADAMLEIARRHRFVPMMIDALELVAIGTARAGSPDAACILDGALAERERIGYRLVMISPRAEYLEFLAATPRSRRPLSLDDAVGIAQQRIG